MRLSEISSRHRYDHDDVPNPEFEIHLFDFEADDENTSEEIPTATVTVEADDIHIEPEEREGGYVRHIGSAHVESYKVRPFTFKGKKYNSETDLKNLFKYFDPSEHEELESLIHAARVGAVHDNHIYKDLDEWILHKLNKNLDIKIPTKRYASD